MESIYLALLMEPEPMQRDLLRLVLQNLGCEVLIADKAGEGVRLVSQHRPDLLVIDTFLPKMNGLDLIKNMREAHLLSDTKVIVISAMGFEEVVRQVAQMGVSACLVKPVDVQAFMRRVKALLAGVPTRAARKK